MDMRDRAPLAGGRPGPRRPMAERFTDRARQVIRQLIRMLAALAARLEATFTRPLCELSDQGLKDKLRELNEREAVVSYERRILHARIDVLSLELVNRLRRRHDGGENLRP